MPQKRQVDHRQDSAFGVSCARASAHLLCSRSLSRSQKCILKSFCEHFGYALSMHADMHMSLLPRYSSRKHKRMARDQPMRVLWCIVSYGVLLDIYEYSCDYDSIDVLPVQPVVWLVDETKAQRALKKLSPRGCRIFIISE